MHNPLSDRPLMYELLDDGTTRPSDAVASAQSLNKHGRIAYTKLPDRRALSTVFLMADHALEGVPILFETAILPAHEGEPIQSVAGYCCRDFALECHELYVADIIAGKSIGDRGNIACPRCINEGLL